jgi:hypothetical protein
MDSLIRAGARALVQGNPSRRYVGFEAFKLVLSSLMSFLGMFFRSFIVSGVLV